jgi:DNA-binding NarL/FixJ family response regulator
MDKINVLIVDEHVAVRRALAARLRSFPHIEVVGTASSVKEGIAEACSTHPDVILMELKGTTASESDPVGEMSKALVKQPAGIIVLTTYADDDEREAAVAAGASRYLLKHIDTASLLVEIESVAAETSNWIDSAAL